MAARTVNILVAGITDLFATLLDDIGMHKKHVFGMAEIVASAIVAETGTVTDIAILLLSFGDGTMGDGPTVIIMRNRSSTNDDRSFNQGFAASPGDGDGVTQVALGTDGSALSAGWIF